MFVTLISWICIGLSAYLWGLPVLGMFRIQDNHTSSFFTLSSVTGLCVLTMFAQIFSLFHGVDFHALITVFLIDAIMIVLNRTKIRDAFLSGKYITALWCIVGAVCAFFVLIIASGYINNSDTYLYHAQAIRWIEEYGAVKGLGNIHSRLAFNSSFLCLQALFSFKGICAHSLHSVNGFIVWLFLTYSLCSAKIWRENRFRVSDFIRVCLVVLLSLNTSDYSSPGTDLFAHALSVYLMCEYVSNLEDGNTSFIPYAFLSVISVYGVTLKLSSAVIVLLAIKPAVILLRERNWKNVLLYLCSGLAVLAPWFARNVILSGYLVYPFEVLDFFNVDWKMPASTVSYERMRTSAWAKEIFGILELNAPFKEWFPYWVRRQSTAFLVFLAVSFCSCAVLVITGFRKFARNKDSDTLYIGLIVTACLAYWFISAPHIRFGRPYTLLPPFLLLGTVLSRLPAGRFSRLRSLAFLLLFLRPLTGIVTYSLGEPVYLLYCSDYEECNTEAEEFHGITFYIPCNENAGYYAFPSVLSHESLDKIELRGDNLSDGFRTATE